jgi:hypothetical protein
VAPKITEYVVTATLRVFGVPLRSRVPVLHWCPFARFPGSLFEGHKGIGTNGSSTLGQRLRSDGR